MAKLYFYYSAMNAGKSLDLIRAAFNYRERGMRVVIYSPLIDTRAGAGRVSSRIGISEPASALAPDADLFAAVVAEHGLAPLACVLVDEAQFLTPDQVMQAGRIADDLNIPVLCYGLRSDFQARPFPGSGALLAIADVLTELKTICTCGRKATMNLRIDASGGAVIEGAQVEIGGNDRYVATCRKHYCAAIAAARRRAVH